MASPAHPASKAPGAFVRPGLSLEDAERFAATFRPSWELDDAAFAGAPSAAHASNGAHSAAGAAAQQVESSVIIDQSLAQDVAPPRPAHRPGATIIGMTVPVQAVPQPGAQTVPVDGAPASPGPAEARSDVPPAPASKPPISQRPLAPSFDVSPPMAARVTLALPAVRPSSAMSHAKKAKSRSTGLWVGLAVAGAIVIGGGVWLAVSSGSGGAQAPAPTVSSSVDDKPSAVLSPPPETAGVTAPQAPSATMIAVPTASVPATAASAAPPPSTPTAAPEPIATVAVTSLPQATAPAPLPRAVAPVAPRPAAYVGVTPSPAPRPAGRKGGSTIIRDVPF